MNKNNHLQGTSRRTVLRKTAGLGIGGVVGASAISGVNARSQDAVILSCPDEGEKIKEEPIFVGEEVESEIRTSYTGSTDVHYRLLQASTIAYHGWECQGSNRDPTHEFSVSTIAIGSHREEGESSWSNDPDESMFNQVIEDVSFDLEVLPNDVFINDSQEHPEYYGAYPTPKRWDGQPNYGDAAEAAFEYLVDLGPVEEALGAIQTAEDIVGALTGSTRPSDADRKRSDEFEWRLDDSVTTAGYYYRFEVRHEDPCTTPAVKLNSYASTPFWPNHAPLELTNIKSGKRPAEYGDCPGDDDGGGGPIRSKEAEEDSAKNFDG